MICRDPNIPEYRTVCSETCRGEKTPGSVDNPDPIYRMPLFSMFGTGIVPPANDIARDALEVTNEGLRMRRMRFGS